MGTLSWTKENFTKTFEKSELYERQRLHFLYSVQAKDYKDDEAASTKRVLQRKDGFRPSASKEYNMRSFAQPELKTYKKK